MTTRSHGTNTSSNCTTPVDCPYLAENFAAASLLALTALVTLVIKTYLEWRHGESLAANHRH